MRKQSSSMSAVIEDPWWKDRSSRGPSCISPTVGIIERAFQVAEQCTSHSEIKAKLKKEGYVEVDAHLAGGKIRSDLSKVLKRNRHQAGTVARDTLSAGP